MSVTVNKDALEKLVGRLVKEDRSYHSKNQNELEQPLTPIFPQAQMAQQLSQSEVPIEDPEYLPANKSELGKAAMQMSKNIKDQNVEKFYTALKKLSKRYDAEEPDKKSGIFAEAKLPQFLGGGGDELPDPPRPRRGRRAEPDIGVLPSTPAEDAADVAPEFDPGRRRAAPTVDTPMPKKKTVTRSPGESFDTGEPRDITANFIKSLYKNIESAPWLENVSIPLSSLVVGDANKLLAAAVKKIGEDVVTPETLEAELQRVVNEMTYSIKGDKIYISVPGYGFNYVYNLYGDKRNLFSLDQYKQLFTALGSQESAGTDFEDSWGPKYAAAISSLAYARQDAELRDALKIFIQDSQEKLTAAVLDSYPATQALVEPKDVGAKLAVINDDVVDAFTQQGLTKGTNTVTVDVLGTPVTLTLNIPASVDDRVLTDVNFSTALLDLLSTSPDALQNHIEKKQRARRSAVQMTRGQENYFYDLGMKIGGPNFKMSAADFQAKLAAAQQVIEDEGLDMSDEELVTMLLIGGGIIDRNQFDLLNDLKEKIYAQFEKSVHGNKNLQQKFGLDGVFEIVPEEMSDMSNTVREVFDDFCELMVKAFTDKSVKNKFFDIYDTVVDNPATKDYFKKTAGSKHSQIYDQPPYVTRRAKDVSNLIGNLRHISEYMLENVKMMRRARSTMIADRAERDAKQLVDPATLSSMFVSYTKQEPKSPLYLKAMAFPEKKLMQFDMATLTQEPERISLKPATPAAGPAAAEVMDDMPVEQPASPEDVKATFDDIIADFVNMAPGDKENLLQDFESAADPEGPGPRSGLKKLYPALSSADYDRLVTQLAQLSESSIRSLVRSIIRENLRR
jgi:hypothetical protein